LKINDLQRRFSGRTYKVNNFIFGFAGWLARNLLTQKPRRKNYAKIFHFLFAFSLGDDNLFLSVKSQHQLSQKVRIWLIKLQIATFKLESKWHGMA
jgi:hypothetical protein